MFFRKKKDNFWEDKVTLDKYLEKLKNKKRAVALQSSKNVINTVKF